MQRLALALAIGAVVAACWQAPGQHLAIGLGIAAIGTGWIGYRRRAAPGLARLAGAGAIALGGLGLALGVLRVALAIAALGHVERMLGA